MISANHSEHVEIELEGGVKIPGCNSTFVIDVIDDRHVNWIKWALSTMQYSTTPAPRAKKVKKTTVKPIIVDLRVRSQ